MSLELQKELASARLYVLVTESVAHRPVEEVTRLALKGGADIIQLREKELPDREYLDLALRVAEAAGVDPGLTSLTWSGASAGFSAAGTAVVLGPTGLMTALGSAAGAETISAPMLFPPVM